jgi:hypothetical protein
MRYCDSILGGLLRILPRHVLNRIVEAHDGDRYTKSFDAWRHLVSLIFAQLSGSASLRALEASWNAHAHHHYHLGSGPVSRSTLADANRRRDPTLFAEVFAWLSQRAGSRLKREGDAVVRLIDATPVPLGQLFAWADWNGRTAASLHVVYNPVSDHPMRIEITRPTSTTSRSAAASPSSRAPLILRQGLCRLRLVDSARCQGLPLRHPAEDQCPLHYTHQPGAAEDRR